MAETSSASEAQILYLEPDDEIPSVVRRVRESELPRVVLVAPGRSKATSSAIGLRLLARHAKEVGRELNLVADPAARTLAAEAGIPAFASIAEAQADPEAGNASAPPTPRPLAAIHVVRGEGASPAARPVVGLAPALEVPAAGPTAASTASVHRRLDETQATPVVAPPAARRDRAGARHSSRSRAALAAMLVALVAAVAIVAAVLPGATVTITPSVSPIGPVSYDVSLPGASDSGSIDATLSGSVTGTYSTGITAASGTVTFLNYSSDGVQVPKGSAVSAGDQVFTTDKTIVVPATGFFFAGRRSVTVTAAKLGTPGNVAAHAIDHVVDRSLDDQLSSGFPQIGRRVDNQTATSGGTSKTGPQVTQKDVDALAARIRQALAQKLTAQLASHPERTYAPPAKPETAAVDVPSGLVGTKDKTSFQLTGTLAYDRRYLTSDVITQTARDRMSGDSTSIPAGTSLVSSSVQADASNLQVSGDLVTASISVRGAVMPQLDEDQVKQRIAGLSAPEARQALESLGAVRIDFWPGWVNAVPRLPFRIDIAIQAPPQATPSSTPTPTPAGTTT